MDAPLFGGPYRLCPKCNKIHRKPEWGGKCKGEKK